MSISEDDEVKLAKVIVDGKQWDKGGLAQKCLAKGPWGEGAPRIVSESTLRGAGRRQSYFYNRQRVVKAGWREVYKIEEGEVHEQHVREIKGRLNSCSAPQAWFSGVLFYT